MGRVTWGVTVGWYVVWASMPFACQFSFFIIDNLRFGCGTFRASNRVVDTERVDISVAFQVFVCSLVVTDCSCISISVFKFSAPHWDGVTNECGKSAVIGFCVWAFMRVVTVTTASFRASMPYAMIFFSRFSSSSFFVSFVRQGVAPRGREWKCHVVFVLLRAGVTL